MSKYTGLLLLLTAVVTGLKKAGYMNDEEFKESDHPRAANGQFGSGGSAGTNKKEKLTSNEKSAVSSYSGDDFLRINKQLRAGDASDPQIARIDAAIDKSPLEAGTVLYRGMTREAAKQLFGGKIEAGSAVSDKSFLSTSKSKDVASQIGLGGVMLKIEVGPGQKGLDMKGLTRNDHEQEVILPRQSKLIVLGTTAPKNPFDPVIVRVGYGKD